MLYRLLRVVAAGCISLSYLGCEIGPPPDPTGVVDAGVWAGEEADEKANTLVSASGNVLLPVEVMGPSGTTMTVSFTLNAPITNITHLVVTCHACGYNNDKLDADPQKVKAAVQVNGTGQVNLKYYTGSRDKTVVGNDKIALLKPDDAAYGGIGGGFRTNSMIVPITGLREGTNTLSFKHVNADNASIGFRILSFNLLRGGVLNDTVLPSSLFTQNDPANWRVADAVGSENAATIESAVNAGRTLWYRTSHLYDPSIDELDGQMGGGRLSGSIRASCSNCHAEDGRDLKYFNFSSESIVARARFHGLTRNSGLKIAAYIRSLDLPVVASARPWNPPYQPGQGIDARPAYAWAAGAGIDAVLDSDAAMKNYLFPRGTSAQEIKSVVDRFGKLNMRELPIALQLPDWNQWLPTVHPVDGFDSSTLRVNQDERGEAVGAPFYEVLYNAARARPTPGNLGDIVKRLGSWMGRGATCYSQQVTSGPGWRATNGLVAQALRLGPSVSPGIGAARCEVERDDRNLTRPLELAKRGLIAWISIKLWELQHTNKLETRGANMTSPVCAGARCVDASEARGWVTADAQDQKNLDVFNRAPHYVAYNARTFQTQTDVMGTYESSAWYHLQMVLNTGYRRTAPSHFAYTQGFIEKLQAQSGVSQSFRFWASVIKMRQTQTNGRYGVENGLDLRTAQPFIYYSDDAGDTRVRAGVGQPLWNELMGALLTDMARDARNATSQQWAAASGLEAVQDGDSREFSPCDECFVSDSNPKPFADHTMQGLNTARLIPRLRATGVSEPVLGLVLDWCQSMWRFGPWESLRGLANPYQFTKPGNNGTVSCDTFCEGAQWGEVGGCVGARRSDTGESLSCSSAPGYLGGNELTCQCTRGFVKPGNNGTVSCGTFCAGAQWGQVGRCVDAVRSDSGQRLTCADAPGYLAGHQLTCQCVP